MQRHGDYRYTVAQEIAFQLVDRLSQHASQNVRRRPHRRILQQINQFPQSAIVAAISRRSHKKRFAAPAQSAERRALILILILRQRMRRENALAANRTHSTPDALQAVEILLADRES